MQDIVLRTAPAPAAGIVPYQNITGSLFDQFVSFIDRCPKTTRTYIVNLRQFLAWLNYRQIRQPSRKDIISYREYLTEEHEAIQFEPGTAAGWSFRLDSSGNRFTVKCKPNTATQYLRSVKQFFAWTASEGLYPDIAANIKAPKVSTDNHRKEAIAADSVLTIEKSITARAADKTAEAEQADKDRARRIQRSTEQGKRLYAMFLLAVNAGLRTVELSRANVKDIETDAGQAYIYIWGKGHTEPDTKKPLAPEVKAAIDDYLKSRSDRPTGNSPLFVSTGNRSRGKRIASTTISTMLKRAMQEAGFNSDRYTAHSLRHTAGTTVLELTGDNIYTTQKYMRHANPATTEIYLHAKTEKVEAGIAQRLYNRYHGISTPEADREQISTIISALSPDQLEKLLELLPTATE